MRKDKIVVMGGGTGTFVVLSGLKHYEQFEITAIVSSADDGGSNKKFRDEFGLLPPSDFAQCLTALSSDEPEHDTMRKLMTYRFSKGLGFEGQRFSNILIAALTDIEGSQLKAFEEIGKILNINGTIVPITTDNIRLMAEYENGEITFGEHLIDEPDEFHNSEQRINKLFTNRNTSIYEAAKTAIKEADYIILGPGDLYTSTLANVIIGNTAEVMVQSQAKIVYIVNLMTKFGQTFGFTAQDHVEEIRKYIGKYPEYVLINNTLLSTEMIERYAREKNDFPVKDNLTDGNYQIIRTDLLSNEEVVTQKGDILTRSLIRHDSDKIAAVIRQLTQNP